LIIGADSSSVPRRYYCALRQKLLAFVAAKAENRGMLLPIISENGVLFALR
jgi:hypothetical protein